MSGELFSIRKSLMWLRMKGAANFFQKADSARYAAPEKNRERFAPFLQTAQRVRQRSYSGDRPVAGGERRGRKDRSAPQLRVAFLISLPDKDRYRWSGSRQHKE